MDFTENIIVHVFQLCFFSKTPFYGNICWFASKLCKMGKNFQIKDYFIQIVCKHLSQYFCQLYSFAINIYPSEKNGYEMLFGARASEQAATLILSELPIFSELKDTLSHPIKDQFPLYFNNFADWKFDYFELSEHHSCVSLQIPMSELLGQFGVNQTIYKTWLTVSEIVR